MYISKIRIQKYRCFDDTTIEFNKGLNVLIGENNSGKTTVLKALRLVFDRSNVGRPTVDDFFKGSPQLQDPPQINITVTIEETDNEGLDEKALVASWLTKLEERWEAKLTYSFYLPDASINEYQEDLKKQEDTGVDLWELLEKYIPKYVVRIYGGNIDSKNRVDAEDLEKFGCECLDALRDVESKMLSGKDTLLKNVLIHFLDFNLREKRLDSEVESKQNDFKLLSNQLVLQLQDRLDIDRILELAKKTGASVGGEPSLNGKLEESDIISVLKLIVKDKLGFEIPISNNGLGYNNLIYISLVLSNLDIITSPDLGENAKIFPILLIEEPEAHLHPALQYNFLKFLNDEIKDKRISKQIFMTTHSTHITAAVGLDPVICMMYDEKNLIKAKYPGKVFSNEDNSKNYLERFLDATKSNMLFSKSVILIEGLAEQLIIPSLSDYLNYSLDENHVAVVQTGSSLPTFKHFLKLFGAEVSNSRKEYSLSKRVACIVDADPLKFGPKVQNSVSDTDLAKHKPKKEKYSWRACYPFENEDGYKYEMISKNVREYEELLNKTTNPYIKIFYNRTSKGKTFEYDLAFENYNSKLFADLMGEIKPPEEVESLMDNCTWEIEDKNKAIFAASYLKYAESSKGVAALYLAHELKENYYNKGLDRVKVNVPEHIRNAITWACGGKIDESNESSDNNLE
ncbi:ATP-dependent nuclease [Methanosarcina mazei]|uniref:ATP-dependent nuclease n=1 Tax=Methanosarcina mazei TaxID=2209 RepID=UPI003C70E2E0